MCKAVISAILPKSASPWLLAVFAAAALPWQVRAADAAREIGHPFLQNFTPRDYRAQAQTWAAAQDAQGLMYFGTKACVLEYDGVSWRKIPVGRPIDVVHALAFDPAAGTMFVGGVNELGYLKTLPGGEKQFVSLLDQLPAEARDFHECQSVYATAEGIVFVADRQVMRWHDGKFKIWPMPGKFRLLPACVAGKVYVQNPRLGLLRLDGEEFVPASTDPIFNKAFVLSMSASPDGSIMVGTYRDGLFTLRDGAATPLGGELNEFFKAKEIRRSVRLRDGSLAIGTGLTGVVVLDKSNRFLDHWDEASGLQNQTCLNMFEDREGGLWLCLEAGITRVEAGSPLSIFDASNGLKRESIRDLVRWRGDLIFSTTTGLYRVAESDPKNADAARCERLPNSDGHFMSLCVVDHGLLASGMPGVCLFGEDGSRTTVYTDATTPEALWRSRVHPDRVYLGTFSGLRSLCFDRKMGRWMDEGLVNGVQGEIRTLMETPQGDLWLGSYTTGVYRVRFAPDDASGQRGAATIRAFLKQPGPLAEEVWAELRPWRGGSEALVYTKTGLFRFDERKDNFESVTEFGARFADGSFRLEDVRPDRNDNLWLVGRASSGVWLDQEAGRAIRAQNGVAASFQNLPHKIADKVDEVEMSFPEDNGIIWVSGPSGLVRFDTSRWMTGAPTPALATLIRRAYTTNMGKTDSASQPILQEALSYTHNSVQFELAADTFAAGSSLRYQTRLVGFGEEKWSAFGERPSASFTNLPEGHYIFEACVRDADGRSGTLASVPFRILPPWQRTAWAYAVYALLTAVGIYGLGRWQLRRLRWQNNRLENIVAARTGELRAHEAELVRAKEEADAANRAKSAFLANMSHELRTPLNAILGYTQILLKDDSLTPRNRERLAAVGQSGGHLLAMINEVLDLSKIEAGKLTLEPVDFRLDQLLDDVCAVFSPRSHEKGLSFFCTRKTPLPEVVHTDAGKLRQVLFNLLSNAFKFTRRGSVRLEVSLPEAGRVRFEVSDTGMGIAPEELNDIFLAFHQANNGRKIAAQGTGLGLAISQRLVELLGSQIQVESVPGQGSRFWFDLALAPVLTSRAFLTPINSPETGQKITGYQGARRRLLIVDDEPENRYVMREMLAPLGFEIEEAADGVECLERCAHQKPDALLLDLRMDRLDGFEVSRTLRRQPDGADIRIIAVSASVFDNDRQQALAAGCDDFLPKPFQEDQLVSVLGHALNLQWIFADPPLSDPTVAQIAQGDVAPPAEEIDAMLELSRRGDILGIKKRLGALHNGGSSKIYGSFVRSLEPLVAGYQMDRIRDTLIRFKENGNG